MKVTKIVLAVLALCAIVACNPNNNDDGGNGGNGGNGGITWSDSGSLVGDWVLTEWNSSTELPMGVYLSLNEDNTFVLYQHLSDVLWEKYEGTYTLSGNTLSGVYSDGVEWADYTIKYNNGDTKQIKLTRKDDAEDVSIYTATDIPAEVIDSATAPAVVRSAENKRFL
ncbi:MAG: lipocalin family protein [Alistipes sp.]|nr:lipocalin family protein [Alistipes sp.]